MANSRNRKRKKVRIPPCKKANKFKHGEPCTNQKPGSSEVKIGDPSKIFPTNSASAASVNEGTIFMDLEILFNVFNEVLRCPECKNSIKC